MGYYNWIALALMIVAALLVLYLVIRAGRDSDKQKNTSNPYASTDWGDDF